MNPECHKCLNEDDRCSDCRQSDLRISPNWQWGIEGPNGWQLNRRHVEDESVSPRDRAEMAQAVACRRKVMSAYWTSTIEVEKLLVKIETKNHGNNT
jgi:hypothetical protein